MYHIISKQAFEKLNLHKQNSLTKDQYEFLISSKEEIKSWLEILKQDAQAKLGMWFYRGKESDAYAITEFIENAQKELDLLKDRVEEAKAQYERIQEAKKLANEDK